MRALFEVTYFDPIREALRMESFTVIAPNATVAIRVANPLRSFKYYRVESVELIRCIDK